MVSIIILGTILMKNNKTEIAFSNYRNFLAKKKDLTSSMRSFTERTKQCAVEYVDMVSDSKDPGFAMAFDKRPINFYPRLYYITYKGIRILPYDDTK